MCAAPKRVACIGNSITYGYGLEHRDSLCYPAVLQRMLGREYEVGNFGLSGATLLRRGHRPYTATSQWRDALAFNPDIALIHLGINDTDPRDWPLYADDFVADYVALIDSLRAVNPDIRIIISRLSPLRSTHYRWRSGTHQWRLDIQEAIGRIADATGAELIDFDATLRDHQYLIEDGIHPNARGAAMMARTAFSGITGRYGGLRLPDVWQSGMVVQRDRPLHIRGTADAASKVKVTVNDGHSVTATTDNRGQWSAILPPFAVGDPYTLTITDGRDTIRLTDVLAGDVWIASGQSNMAFTLNASVGGEEAIARSSDPMLRFYNQRPRAYTDAARWSDEVIAAIDTLDYYLPAVWQQASPESTPSASAIAYYFGKELRERTDVPVGIIENAVGGSTLESWIDITTLEAGMPEILVNWRTNDYLQPWAQQRANENTSAEGNHRHPYEPTYLYSAGIRPLEGFDVSGVIWYQGESNAHNTMLFERLFPMFVSSWREALGNPVMPIHTVQLSSIDRSSWPEFRDAQRRLADRLEGVTLTVSSDLGDSLDVHPRHKRPIGRRLALQALRRPDEAPLFGGAPEARVAGDRIVLTFPAGVSLATADGLAPRTFEIAAIDGLYAPATATITKNTIMLMNPDIKHPQFVRYGWQPYTRANVINTPDSLPLSTFKLRVEGSPEIEAGMEYGVSAPFATLVGSDLIMAGGCNFPTDTPLAPDARKKFYQGIY
ncbi:MAG: cyclically-permuted mutarotase family protein, partial [Paramuribaculum sp.]|nr:cyclically-permuted mutarotase family protein [Paramuribaculum sp.]